MSDFVQTVIVTLAAATALVALVWSYAAPRKAEAPSCTNCAGGTSKRRPASPKA